MDAIEKLFNSVLPEKKELIALLECDDGEVWEKLFGAARAVCEKHYGNKVFARGLIEFTSYCKNDCFYCGLRRSNSKAQRYRLSFGEILERCESGYALGFRTFVLQGGEDGYFDDESICRIVREIKRRCGGCAVTLSLGERPTDSFKAFFDAGADRYLLRHETVSAKHYALLHPPEMSYAARIDCLYALKAIGFQTGCGFMVGTPFQTTEMLADELAFLTQFKPHMAGIGPFLPHRDTPFKDFGGGSVQTTLKMLALSRLLCPEILLPATTALGTAAAGGRERGILAGANVVMPNLSPASCREKYSIYDNKLNTGAESSEGLAELAARMKKIGRVLATCRGDSLVKN